MTLSLPPHCRHSPTHRHTPGSFQNNSVLSGFSVPHAHDMMALFFLSPTVAIVDGWKRPSQNERSRDVLPTLELPTSTTLKSRSGACSAPSLDLCRGQTGDRRGGIQGKAQLIHQKNLSGDILRTQETTLEFHRREEKVSLF